MDDDTKDPEPVEPLVNPPAEPEPKPKLPEMGHLELRGGRDDDNLKTT